MRKWPFNKQVSCRETALLALLAAIAVHAVFLLPGYRTPQRGLNRKNPGVQILNMGSLSSREYTGLKNWISIHDPARAAKSRSASGYMAYLPRKKTFSVPVVPFVEEKLQTPPVMGAFTPLPTAPPPAAALPEEELVLPGEDTVKTKIFDHNGRMIDLALQLPPGAAGRKPTVIALRKAGKVHVISLLESSGTPVLDTLARNAAARWNAPEGTTLTFVWPAEVEK